MSVVTKVCWLPGLLLYSPKVWPDWDAYEDMLYQKFSESFISQTLSFKGKPVRIRKHPIQYDKVEAFYHVTTKNYINPDDRHPDFRRCERILWIKEFIQNSELAVSKCACGSDIKIWLKKNRWHLLCEEERYLLILEERDSYVLLITAFYLEQDNYLQKRLKEYKASI